LPKKVLSIFFSSDMLWKKRLSINNTS
jgi:hypothetical protein